VLAIMGVPLPASIGVVSFIGAYTPFIGGALVPREQECFPKWVARCPLCR
jgi:hypothetical protein